MLPRLLTCSSLTGAALVLSALPAAAATTVQQIDCAGQTLTIRTPDNHSSEHGGFSVAQVVDGGSGHLIPLSFSFSAYDETADTLLFSDTVRKGGGHADHQQTTTTCGETSRGTLADLLGPGEPLPEGTRLTDVVTVTVSVVVVAKP